MTIILLIIFLGAAGSLLIPRQLDRHKGILLSLLPLTAFVFYLIKGYHMKQVGPEITSIAWLPQLGLNITWLFDGVSLLFLFLVSGIGVLILIYSNSYMKHDEGRHRFYFFILLFMGAMLGLVLSGNLLVMFLFWELTSFTSYFLISFKHEYDKARQAAMQSLLITVMGGLALFAGILLLGQMGGTYELAELVEKGHLIRFHPHYFPALLLILAGVVTKSAQFPFHFWLPGAMQAPSPVSAYLHSATMVKAGIFLLARMSPIMGGTPEWKILVSLIGGLTMFVGAYLAITQTDLKAILAYTTISALGTLVLLFGIDTQLSVKAALIFLIVHAFYKASLFMVAGMIDHKTGTRDINLLGGLRRLMPKTTVVTVLALLSMAGLPPLLGFIGKELIYEAKIQTPGIASVVLILGVASNVFMVWVSAMFGYRTFFGKLGTTPKVANEKGWELLFGPSVLAFGSLALGLFTNSLGQLIELALSTVRAQPLHVEIHLWHGFNQVFLLSVITVAAGVFLFSIRQKLLPVLAKINSRFFAYRFADLFNRLLDNFVKFSKNKTAVIQHGYHRFYLMTILVVATAFVWFQIYVTRGWDIQYDFSPIPFYVLVLTLIMIFSALTAAFAQNRLTAIISMGVIGFGIALIYLFYGAVDLAITQILAETLTVVLFVLVIQKMPRYAKFSSRKSRVRDAIIALSSGSFVTILVLNALQIDYNDPISDFFIKNSLPGGFGENVVNVILVDFRALDTLGEITVLSVAALGVYTLIKMNKVRK
ncbi:hydrogen gas-evolving membrane-bound hydrogenase subunit E [Gaoshiqia sediminis]|uniref:Proton-conducting transporter membrane subunit n=1 Tax=Gaoshiqia sediminis TaxID=2986998 RepID=A0AA41Y3K6_9BACT|nr:hydrogen gas-evolving membrane-bound hydrogenase subunit E [Gaoshiqia sediminis]MCW0482804.1 proton-conducting transporter membrane subunit [Gaoshiqia sediminis]